MTLCVDCVKALMMKDWPLILVTHQASIFLTAVCSYASSLKNSSRDQLESQLVIMSAKLAREEDRIFEFINQLEDKFYSLFSVLLRLQPSDRVIVSYAAAGGVCQQHYPDMKLTTRTNTAVNTLLLYLYDEIKTTKSGCRASLKVEMILQH
jgi:hypothetical protein